MNILVLTTGHPANDERLLYKIGITLKNAGHNVTIISTLDGVSGEQNGIQLFSVKHNSFVKKIFFLYQSIVRLKPDIILSAEIFPVFPSALYKLMHSNAPVIYDCTEWYPENITIDDRGSKKYFKYALHYVFFLKGIRLTDGFLFGEQSKIARIIRHEPAKRYFYLPYYPHKSDVPSSPLTKKARLHLAYTGILSERRGFLSFLKSLEYCDNRFPKIKLEATLIGKFPDEPTRQNFYDFRKSFGEKIQIHFHEWTDYRDLPKLLSEVDICVDLRERNSFFNSSLPIKLFDYMAMGKPVIFTALRAINIHHDVSQHGFLVDPNDREQVILCYKRYYDDRELLKLHSENAARLADERFNWERYERTFLEFIEEMKNA